MKRPDLDEQLAVFRETVLREARERAQHLLRTVTAEAAEALAQAEREAERLIEAEREAGRRTAREALERELLAARRRARSIVLTAQSDACQALREQALASLADVREQQAPAYVALLCRLARRAGEQLGPGADIVRDGPGGGVSARLEHRSVDYTLGTLVDQAIAGLGDELAGLWE